MGLLEIGVMALVALGVDVLNDKIPVLRDITHANIISESTSALVEYLRAVVKDGKIREALDNYGGKTTENPGDSFTTAE